MLTSSDGGEGATAVTSPGPDPPDTSTDRTRTADLPCPAPPPKHHFSEPSRVTQLCRALTRQCRHSPTVSATVSRVGGPDRATAGSGVQRKELEAP